MQNKNDNEKKSPQLRRIKKLTFTKKECENSLAKTRQANTYISIFFTFPWEKFDCSWDL